MKKIVAIVGSPRKERSTTYKIITELVDKFKLNNQGLHFDSEIFNLTDLNISPCKGCMECFAQCGSCVSFQDDMKIVESALLQSDVVIFGSPVYAHNITGSMKTFFDRISYWLHIMRLVGKYGISVSVSSSNGNIYVNNYLIKMMGYLGIKPTGIISYTDIHGLEDNTVDDCVNKTIKALKNEITISASEFQEAVFRVYKKTYESIYSQGVKIDSRIGKEEANYWCRNGYFEFNSFDDLFNRKLELFSESY